MKNLILISLGLLLWLPAQVSANGKLDYKCFLGTSLGEDIAFYRWEVKALELNQRKLVGAQNTNMKGKQYFIKEAFECVPLGTLFKSGRAQKLDRETPR